MTVGPEVVLDRTDPGDDTQLRFRYQHAYGVILLVAAKSGKRPYVAVWCEHHEDLLAERNDGAWDSYQVKTGTPENGAWEVTDKAMKHAVKRFVALDKRFPGRVTSHAFVSNVKYFETEQKEKLAKSPVSQTTRRRIRLLPERVTKLQNKADGLANREVQIRRDLKEARVLAERDVSNLKILKELFLDCIVRSKLAGFSDEDLVTLGAPSFTPEISSVGSEEVTVTSFDTLGSGGKKTLFKCCFALAVHRLARKLNSILPTLLIIDSPMKNISERENRTQFEGFHQLLYELASGELSGTQFILIDKEFCGPVQNFGGGMKVRHMTVDDPRDPPLITRYRGK